MTQSDYSPNMGEPSNVSDSISQLNSLLRGELSACETYDHAIDKVEDSDDVSAAEVDELRQMREDHDQAASVIRDRILELGGEPSDSSGAWGMWASTVQNVSSIFGDTSALKALKEGEEHGLKDYNDSLSKLDMTSRRLVEQLIPQQQQHISLLDRLINSVGNA